MKFSCLHYPVTGNKRDFYSLAALKHLITSSMCNFPSISTFPKNFDNPHKPQILVEIHPYMHPFKCKFIKSLKRKSPLLHQIQETHLRPYKLLHLTPPQFTSATSREAVSTRAQSCPHTFHHQECRCGPNTIEFSGVVSRE